ncbi:50S ribosomal protein L29 [Prochlorothrix hollandica]|uniref:Large ribosomal subunit protein uL29 n=1 Tax=Prochlorothrix hollandica PCC 9006 = CALU 1027 TaxID=317619 RepID=A0A0M2PRT1_PROHO|nr:50S ribosomal protein L29 [Prochlorothrix hollandica]KKI98864.1 50S ribosomal protein L29 [Prochlorothrix hollandica PCC 9006 = CALU 1027]
MALSKAREIRELSDETLDKEILEAKRKLFDLRFQKATRQLENRNHEFQHLKHRLAQLMTVERERQLAQVSPGAGEAVATPES